MAQARFLADQNISAQCLTRLRAVYTALAFFGEWSGHGDEGADLFHRLK